MKIALTGGGTGGHLMPLVAIAKKLRQKMYDVELVFIGTNGKFEQDIMKKENIPTKPIITGKFRRYFSVLNFLDLFKIPIGIIQSLWYLLIIMPDAIFAKGGFASFPVVLAGFIYRIPILIHESDAIPGMANAVMAKISDRVAVSYSEAEQYFPADQVVLTGNPVRIDINRGDPEKAKKMFNLIESKKILFVMGGSQGAQNINNHILNVLPMLLHEYQVIHQTGENNYEDVVHIAGELGIKAGREGYHPITSFGDEIKDILAASDLVISRAGANSIAEIAANCKPSILIPIEHSANNHQRMNAFSVAKRGGCLVLEENNLGEHMFLEKIHEIMNNQAEREKMANNIKSFYHADAADRIAEGILGMVKK
jgi:UDP-N-acetylglucosamine--N-acetylmuramyl-(pentapeptide) pyrophosphoryl-undecaprenol N-acetylglucosamine transferase